MSATFPPDLQSARRAREFVAAGLRDAGVEEADLADRLGVIISELVTNAVLHARSDVVVRVSIDSRDVWLEVIDQEAARPYRATRSLTSTSGRGIILVDALVDDWGVAMIDGGRGKAVWGRVHRT